MLESITSSGLTAQALAICSIVSILMGLVVAFTHTRTARYTKNFAVTLVVLPILVQGVMMMVNGNLGTGVAILGAFSLVRFRSIPGTSREIVSVFFAMSIGLATGTGFVGFAVIATVAIASLLFALHKLAWFDSSSSSKVLKITIPEDLDYTSVFDKVFSDHKVVASIQQLKTKNMGSLYELVYDIDLPELANSKKFIDDLRVRNGNLAIVLHERISEGGL